MEMTGNGRVLYEFGSFTLDTGQGVLLRKGESVHLAPKSLEILAYLLERSNEVVSKEELMEAVWPDSFVEEANLVVHISAIRKLLASNGIEPISIDTFPKRGYRLSGEIRARTNANGFKTIGKPNTVSPIDFPVGDKRKKSVSVSLILLGLIAVLLTTGYVLNRWIGYAYGKTLTTTRIQGTEKSSFFSISPNGEYLAHNIFNDGKRGLTLTHLATNSNIQLVEPEDFNYLSITFTPNGSHIYFVKSKLDTPNTLYKIPILGGEAVKIMEKVDGRISFAPDGSRFAFYRRNDESKTTSLMTAKSDGTDEIVLSTLDHPDHFSRNGVAWSPDGKTIVAAVYFRTEKNSQYLMAVDIATGEMKPLMPNDRWAGWESFEWLPDGSGLIAAMRKEAMVHNHLFYVPFPTGDPVQLSTGDISGFRTISVTSDGKTIVAENYSHQTEIWYAGMQGNDDPYPITKERHHFFRLIRWTPDGRIVFSSDSGGNRDLWIIDRDGSGAKQVTENSGRNEMPYAAADNKHVVFVSNRLDEAVYNVWRAELDGRNAVRLVAGSGEQFPVVSPDMKWVIYENTPMYTQPESSAIFRIPFEGGEPIQLAPVPSQQAHVSPDSTLVAFTHKPTPDSKWMIAMVPIEGGPIQRLLDLPAVSPVRWTPDGRAISYIKTENGVANLWAQPIDGSEPYQITNFRADGIPSYCDWSAEFGLICSRGRVTRDAVLIKDFR
jgi:DNA-binding winged helix-turn-helix (wHTH) protein/Tol biopolymer transport system component